MGVAYLSSALSMRYHMVHMRIPICHPSSGYDLLRFRSAEHLDIQVDMYLSSPFHMLLKRSASFSEVHKTAEKTQALLSDSPVKKVALRKPQHISCKERCFEKISHIYAD
ncbi:hypothetical protein KP509_14G087700 [Ceratopteris richardii]|uniref:Uncharacterized protein n=1 Tax=Ceratopteris richardii TaxID=49495 RepID=A0A8T2TF78_CERRI|nr:hypothetical protein KP509_14G087700 [Ceratopteris richardii]